MHTQKKMNPPNIIKSQVYINKQCSRSSAFENDSKNMNRPLRDKADKSEWGQGQTFRVDAGL